MDWLLIGGVVLVIGLAVAGALRLTGDGYRGVHTGRETYPARHQAMGLDDPTTQIVARGRAQVPPCTCSTSGVQFWV